MRPRLVFLDYLRAFVIFLVVLHHAFQAYTSYACYNLSNYVFSSWLAEEAARSFFFDFFQGFQDMYFMPLLFLISGFFAMPLLARKGPLGFLKERFRRLGLPFLFGITVLAPIAAYAAYRLSGAEFFHVRSTGGAEGFLHFWTSVFFKNHWYAGPYWFLWVLLLFSCVTVLLAKLPTDALPSLSQRLRDLASRPFLFAGFLWLTSWVVYALPLWFAPSEPWSFRLAPLWVQGNRIPLYAAYYFLGVLFGFSGPMTNPLFQKDGPIARFWPLWLTLSTAVYFISLAPRHLPVEIYVLKRGICLSAVCAFQTLALISIFSRFFNRESALLNLFSRNAFTIYLIHFPIVVWLQVGLLKQTWSPFTKAFLVAGLGWFLSLGCSEMWTRIKSRTKVSPAS